MPRYGTMVSCRTAATTAPTAASVRLIWRDPRRGAWPLPVDRNEATTEVAAPARPVYRPSPNRGNRAQPVRGLRPGACARLVWLRSRFVALAQVPHRLDQMVHTERQRAVST